MLRQMIERLPDLIGNPGDSPRHVVRVARAVGR
jgi:hypothetical protein